MPIPAYTANRIEEEQRFHGNMTLKIDVYAAHNK